MKNLTRRSALGLLGSAAPVLNSSAWAAAPSKFEPTWDSLKQYHYPEWFRDAKFGIWAHWGPQCVGEFGDWYARKMYIEGDPFYDYHLKKYGHPSKFGYKDIIQLWKAENFDPAKLMQRYKAAGAKYFVSLAVHHDNYDCWNSKHHKWNAVKAGPKKDIVGMWQKEAVKNGLRFGVTEHLERSYSWFNTNKGSDKKGPLAGVPYDGNDPKYVDLYHPKHDDTNPQYPVHPSEAWKQQWLKRIVDLIDSYKPDLLYTDGGIPFGDVGRQMVAHLYNQSMKWHGGKLEAVYNIKNVKDDKHGDYVDGCCVLDLERGVVSGIHPNPWQTDTCIGNWYYKKGMQYKTADIVIDMLLDIVSKNGNLLLNFPLRPDGTLDSEEDVVLAGITKWMAMNSEAIHGTRPWALYGEGPTQTEGGQFGERKLKVYTGGDIRFTTKGRTLYASALAWPGSQAVVKSLGSERKLWFGEIRSVQDAGSSRTA